tara:strand:- start:184 stop:627 length:444 start_codon:yes stop_codon:yes gene_type:complete
MDERYQKSQIYLIKSDNCNKGYVGHTIQGLKLRLSKHVTDYKGWLGLLNKPRNYRGSFDILCEEDYHIYLLEDFPCNNKKEVEKRETMWIFKMSATLEMTNKNMPSKLVIQDMENIINMNVPEILSKKELIQQKKQYNNDIEDMYDC